MPHDQYIANIQYKIHSLFYEYANIEMGKYQTYDYYNEYTNLNHYDRLMLEAAEKKGIIRRIIDGIMKIIRTIVDKVRSFFSKNKNIKKNATVKVDKNLLDRVDNFKKKSTKSKLGFTILATALGAVGAPVLGPKISAHMYKRANNSEEESLIKTKAYDDKLSKIGADLIVKGKRITPDDPNYYKEVAIMDLLKEMHNITKELEGINKDLESILSKTPEDVGKSEKDFIQSINKLSIEGRNLLDDIMMRINEINDMDRDRISKKTLDKYDTEKDKYNKLQDKIADRYGNKQNNSKPTSTSGMFALDGGGSIMMDMSASSGFIQGLIIADLKNATAHCDDKELNNLANSYANKCKSLAQWCIKHAYHDNDYTEEAYNKIYSDCKKGYDSIMGKTVSSADGGSLVVSTIKKINGHLNDIHSGAKKLQAIWDKNNK